jgi:hypothetical protein
MKPRRLALGPKISTFAFFYVCISYVKVFSKHDCALLGCQSHPCPGTPKSEPP